MTAGIVNLETYRARDDARADNDEPRPDRATEAAKLLAELKTIKRLRDDGLIIARNLGRMIVEFDRANHKALAKSVLGNKWEHRKRYVLFPWENETARHAASGGDFARIIGSFAEEKRRKGFDNTNTIIETVYRALTGTSFRPSRFRMPDGAGDAAYLIETMEKVLHKLAHTVDLAGYFELVSKYPIYPADEGRRCLKLQSDRAPNDLHQWDDFVEEDELQHWIPWWAPKCVIGHLYVPFNCNQILLPESATNQIKKACGGNISDDNWTDKCSLLLQSHLVRSRSSLHTVWHRLPVWMIVLRSPNGLVPCLYASIHYREDFQIGRAIANETYDSYSNIITPCFVEGIGESLKTDSAYFSIGEYEDPYYIGAFGDSVQVIGEGVDTDLQNFKAEFSGFPWSIDEIPVWLHPHPVQQLLKLSIDSDPAKLFALSKRFFPKDLRFEGLRDNDTVFRPSYSDLARFTPPLRQNTIAAYLLRNFMDTGSESIFEALKNDTLAKNTAAHELVAEKISTFQNTFNERFGK